MAALVIDSSLVAAWCFPEERNDYANATLRMVSAPLEALAPRLWAYEVRNSVLMGLRRKRISHADAEQFFESIRGLPIRLTDPVSHDIYRTIAGSPRLIGAFFELTTLPPARRPRILRTGP